MGLTPEQDKAVWRAIDQLPMFWTALPTLASHSEWMALERLRWISDLYFVTARHNQRALDETRTWLTIHGIGGPNIILAKNKGYVARAIEATYAIDDKPSQCLGIKAKWPACRTYIMDRPYNQDLQVDSISRVTSLYDFITIVRETKE